jgi:hypothetical protein
MAMPMAMRVTEYALPRSVVYFGRRHSTRVLTLANLDHLRCQRRPVVIASTPRIPQCVPWD